ncbi:MAG: peptidoglycan glycosyltransferase, partial [Saprospiraceae bacterium]|nr:peptidoglycan glycosyltransferase [Saprospiraceae bacterium]
MADQSPLSFLKIQKAFNWVWVLLLGGILAVLMLILILANQDLPSFEDLENPKSNLASEVLAVDASLLGRYYVENRIPVDYEELSPHLIDALIATEDERYHRHSGIDFRGLVRAVVKTGLLRQTNAGGASTITQQLAKLLFTKKPGSGLERLLQKFKEWIIAVKLERSYTKEEIIAMYLNKFNFINGAYGIRAASEIYFGKTQDALSVQEAATLVGMLKNPSLYNPIRRPERTQKRREVVLKQMHKNDLLSRPEYDSLRLLPLDMTNFRRETHNDGLAPYFRMELRKELSRIFDQEEYRKSDGSKYNIFKDGLRIYTTLDPTIQQYAEESMWDHMADQQKKFDRVWRRKDPWEYRAPEMEKDGPEENDMMIRLATEGLTRDIRETGRYGNLKGKHLLPFLREMS